MASIAFEAVTKEYVAGGPRAVHDVSLEIGGGEFFVLVGPSGCGKTTLLRMIAGLVRPTGGSIRIGERDVTYLPPRDRDIAMVFQNYAIYPHMTVRKNMGYGLRVRGMGRHEVNTRVEEVADLLGLGDMLDRNPSTLSGGQLQRVAIGRAIARQPSVYLMDEPLSNLDAKLRVAMRAELGALHARLGVTTVYVTHDQVEAMTLGDRVAVMRAGVVQQVDRPQRLYDEPANAFVARFIGSPAMNLAVGRCQGGSVSFAGVDVRLPGGVQPPVADGTRVLVGVRPDGLREPGLAPATASKVDVTVTVREDLGSESLVFFTVLMDDDEQAAIRSATFEDGVTHIGTPQFATYCARVSPSHPGRPGDVVTLAIVPEALHFFDVDSGDRLASEPSVAEPTVHSNRARATTTGAP